MIEFKSAMAKTEPFVARYSKNTSALHSEYIFVLQTIRWFHVCVPAVASTYSDEPYFDALKYCRIKIIKYTLNKIIQQIEKYTEHE